MTAYFGLLTNLQKLDLSSNKIKALPGPQVMERLENLKVFYLHNNLIKYEVNIESLAACRSLMHLSLKKNPIEKSIIYRQTVVAAIPQIWILDNNTITDDERYWNLSKKGVRFTSMSTFTNVALTEFNRDLTANQHLARFNFEMVMLKSQAMRNSAVIRM